MRFTPTVVTTIRPLLASLSLWLLLAALPGQASAARATDWGLCPAPQGIPAAPEDGVRPAEEVRISADQVEGQSETSATFSGHVVVKRGTTEVQADTARYDKLNDSLQLEGNVSYQTPQLYMQGAGAQLQLGNNSGELRNISFFFREFHAFGEAERIDISDPQRTRLEGVLYTTCNPQKQDWRLKASTLSLDRTTNTGEATSVSLAFKGVPFLYLPYINFPLEGRKSGFLAPSFGRTETAGNDIRLPYYWNIAPEYDATLTPRNIALRGNMLMTEGRYLTPGDGQGHINIDYMPDDQIFDDKRYHSSFEHRSALRSGWGVDLLHNYVSDPYYFNDMTTSQLAASQTHLERRADLSYRASHWSLLARAQEYQTLFGSEPYSRLPQLALSAEIPRRPGRPYASLDTEAVHFRHSSEALPVGTRVDLTPSLSLPLQGPAWSLTPKVSLRHTEYDLQHTAGGDARFSRTLPVTSLDGGLFFERETRFGETAMVQTLEPRLYYLHTPYLDQDPLPLFDTGYYDFSFSQLFRDNRFSGADRVGDANQLTTSLTSRYLEEASGKERARASLGQITYFEDRRVNLVPGSDDTRNRSDLVGEVVLRPLDPLEWATAGRWSPQTHQEDLLTSSLRYRPAEDRVASLAYRYQREIGLRQTDLTAFWPLTRQWRFIGRWQYDIDNHLSYDTVGGLEYQSCCWGLRLVGRGRYSTTTQAIEHSIYLTLELKGLTSIGNRLDGELERGILGFPIH